MIPTNMLELQKLVLENVYDDKTLFEKELRKSFKWLGYNDLKNLYNWAIAKFENRYGKIIDCVFIGFGFSKIDYIDKDFQSTISVL